MVERDGQQLTADDQHDGLAAARPADPDNIVQVGFLGVSPTTVRDRQGPASSSTTMGDGTGDTVQGARHACRTKLSAWPRRRSALEDRDPNSPMSVVGASRVAGEMASRRPSRSATGSSRCCCCSAGLNLFVGMFNFIPLLPLDGGHIAGALYEALRRGFAQAARRPDPGYVDVAKLLPIAYAVASVLLVMGVVLISPTSSTRSGRST